MRAQIVQVQAHVIASFAAMENWPVVKWKEKIFHAIEYKVKAFDGSYKS